MLELRGQALGDRVLGVGLLHGEDVLGPWKPCDRQPPAIAFSNSSQFGLVKALEAWWKTTSPLPSRTAFRNASLLASDQWVSGGPLAVSL